MKKIILIVSILSVLAVACNSKNNPNNPATPATGDKPLTVNVPSDDKTVKEGTPLASWDGNAKLISASVAANNAAAAQEYTLLERLYSTTWYQSEDDYDDGMLETEETFIFFDPSSKMVQREYENGQVDERDEYSELKWIEDITIPNAQANKDRNACIVQNIEKDGAGFDTEYEGYYLVDRDTLYIVDGDTVEEVRRILEDIIAGNTQIYAEDKFVLSTKTLN